MEFTKECCKRFILSAAGTLGVLVILGVWSSGLEDVFAKRTEKILSKVKEDGSK